MLCTDADKKGANLIPVSLNFILSADNLSCSPFSLEKIGIMDGERKNKKIKIKSWFKLSRKPKSKEKWKRNKINEVKIRNTHILTISFINARSSPSSVMPKGYKL